MKTLMITTAAALMFTGTAFAADSAWDTDKDGMISADEYAAGMHDDMTFSAWDADKDGMLSADEFAAGNWRMHDMDGDNMWNADETKAWVDAATRSGSEVSK